MTTETPTRDEVCRRGQQIVDGLPEELKRRCDGQRIVVDVASGDYEIDPRGFLAASRRLRARRPEAVGFWCRVGDDAAFRIGGVRRGSVH